MHTLLLQVSESPESGSMLMSLPWIDKLAGLLILLFVFLGVIRGLWWQVIRMAGFIGAFAAARLFSPKLEPILTGTFGITDERFSQGIAWIVLFLVGLGLAVLLGRLGNTLLESLKLGLVNRAAGGLAGAATAIMIHSALLAVLSLFAPGGWLNEELQDSYSAELLDLLAQRWPVIVDSEQGAWIGSQLEGPSLPKVQ